MRERPMLFSSKMVNALLAGAKTQTRRIVKPQPEPDEQYGGHHWPSHAARSMVTIEEMSSCCPHGTRGDRLWVKETHASQRQEQVGTGSVRWVVLGENGFPERCGALYRASHRGELASTMRWRPSIHMPRVLSRITLAITNVRVERLQAITEADAKAEGAAHRIAPGGDLAGAFAGLSESIGYRAHFADLWREINGAESWDANPWVWVLALELVTTRRVASTGPPQPDPESPLP